MNVIFIIILMLGVFSLIGFIQQSFYLVVCELTKTKKRKKPCGNWRCPDYKFCDKSKYFKHKVDESFNSIEDLK